MKNLVIVTLDGYSSGRLDVVVLSQIYKIGKGFPNRNRMLFEKSRFSKSRKRKVKRFIEKYNCEDSVLLLIGKSYGAKSLVQIVNSMTLRYHRTYMLTIDPCWPKFFNWTPNCNDSPLFVKNPNIYEICNVYIRSDIPKLQCGAPVYSMYSDTIVHNYRVLYPLSTHNDITKFASTDIRLFLKKAMVCAGIKD